MLTNKKIRSLVMVVLVANLILAFSMVAFAGDTNYAERGAKVILDNAFWVVLVVCVIIIISAFLKHSTITIVMTIIIGGIIAYFCKYPEKLTVVGETLSKAVLGG